MNYSEMTDFEINMRVAELIGGFIEDDIFEKEQTIFRHHGSGKYSHFDPCNSWADAGPIILANKITISAPMEYDQPADWLAYPASDSDICVSHPNPLRAAMTAFLVMLESNNA